MQEDEMLKRAIEQSKREAEVRVIACLCFLLNSAAPQAREREAALEQRALAQALRESSLSSVASQPLKGVLLMDHTLN